MVRQGGLQLKQLAGSALQAPTLLKFGAGYCPERRNGWRMPLLGENQLAILGKAQAVRFASMFDQDFATVAEQISGTDVSHSA